jgi:hypothetical protein
MKNFEELTAEELFNSINYYYDEVQRSTHYELNTNKALLRLICDISQKLYNIENSDPQFISDELRAIFQL